MILDPSQAHLLQLSSAQGGSHCICWKNSRSWMCQRSRLETSGRQCHLPNYHSVYIRKPCILGNIIFGGNCQPLPKRCLHSSQILCGRLVWWAWVPQLQNMEHSWSQTLSTLGWQGWPEGHRTSPSPSTQVNGKFILESQQVAVIMCTVFIYIYFINIYIYSYIYT